MRIHSRTAARNSRITGQANLLALLLTTIFVPMLQAQPAAGPDANPLRRMSCPTAGDVRNDNGNCVRIENYLSTGSNRIFWVDRRNGNDGNPGTKDSPWRTIERSTHEGVLLPGDAVIVRGGIYRESIWPQVAGESGRRITFAAYPGEGVVVTGAEVRNDGWTRSADAWRRDWTLPLPIRYDYLVRPEMRREMVIVDGDLLTQVYRRTDVVPGTFFVEGSDTEPVAIYMRLPGDAAPGDHRIEIAERSGLFIALGSGENFCGGRFGWYRLIGFTFRHATNHSNDAAVCLGNEGSLAEENTIEWTNGLGLGVAGRDNVYRGNRSNDNGEQGMGGLCRGCLLEYNETSRNNWRGHRLGFAAAGIKMRRSRNMVIRHHLAADNEARGIWFDVESFDNVIENSVAIRNLRAGILLELTYGTLVRNNVIFGTRFDGGAGSGIQTHAANNNVIVHNTIVSNEGTGISIRLNFRAEDGHNTVYNNLLINNGTTIESRQHEIRIEGETLEHARTNMLDGNVYWSAKRERGAMFFFRTQDGHLYSGNDLLEWRDRIGSDANARLAIPSKPTIEDMERQNGWRLVEESQALGAGSRLPGGVDASTDVYGRTRPIDAADAGAHQYSVASPPPAISRTIGESGTVTTGQASFDEWHRVTLEQSYADPVVVMSPVSHNGRHPSTVRVRNVRSNGFEFQIREWEYLDGRHTEETLHYLVVEAGRHLLEDGRELEAGHATRSSRIQRLTFERPFATRPVVFSQVVTFNDPKTVVTRQRHVNGEGVGLFLQGEEANPSHGQETVAYVAMTMGSGTIGGRAFAAGVTPEAVTREFYRIDFGRSFSSEPVFLAAMQTVNEFDTATLRYRNLTVSRVAVMIEEEQSNDAEMNHAPEVVGFLALEPGLLDGSHVHLVATSVVTIGESGTVTTGQASFDEWHRVTLEQSYADPVVVMSPVSHNGPDPSTVRVRNVRSNGFEFQIREWEYLDGWHMEETLHYLVVEAGRHLLEDGRELEAGHATRNSRIQRLTFEHPFATRPVVFSQVVTFNDPKAVVTRQRHVNGEGVGLFLQGEEANPSHGQETVAYVAMTMGSGTIGGRAFVAGVTPEAVTHEFYRIDFGRSFSSEPIFLAAMQTVNEFDTATLRYRNLTDSRVAAMIEEEQSNDAEMNHAPEVVGFLALEPGPLEASGILARSIDGALGPPDVASGALESKIQDEPAAPPDFAVLGNYPNPFNPRTVIQYSVPESIPVRIEVFDATGRRITVLVDEVQSAGTHEATFDASNLASGVYFYTVRAGGHVKTQSMLLVK